MSNTLPFSEEKQQAFLGHLLKDFKFFDKSIGFVQSDWFINPVSAKIFSAIEVFYKTFNRPPSLMEIKNPDYYKKIETDLLVKIPDIIDKCDKYTENLGLDVIKQEIDSWFSMNNFKKTVAKSAHEFNSGNLEKAWGLLDEGCIRNESSSFITGAAPTFATSPSRAGISEKLERLEQSKRILSYGVPYLDHSLGGIMPNDLILLGAKSGLGKTQLANNIASINAAKGFPVHYFALEAENGEMERRRKFSILSDLYYENTPMEEWGPFGSINYLDWRLGRLEALLAPFEKQALDRIDKELKTLYTLYRTSGDFGLESLERHLKAIGKNSSLIVIDHIHYIDVDGQNENKEYKDIIKRIRDSVLTYGVPVIVIAHLRKEQNTKLKGLVPTIEDFHGSSDLFKIVTSAVMLAPAYDEVKDAPHLWPTYIKSVKARLDQTRTRYTGIVNFNIKNNTYENGYKLGKLVSGDTEWQALEGNEIPYWAMK